MTSQTSTDITSASSASKRNASQHSSEHTSLSVTRSRPSHKQLAPALTMNSSKSSTTVQNAQHASEAERSMAARGYSAHLPYNPNRPPPHTYTRQHEFPPFPPLAQHPVLPFLTTAFTDTQEPQDSPLITKPGPTPAPRANATGRHNHSLVSIPTMDVSKNDLTVTFIRPPLVVPLTRLNDPSIDPAILNGTSVHGEPAPGTPLTYSILHTHRNWFLDPDDFRKDNPNRIDYPPELEPPRGWAPLHECTGAGAIHNCKQARESKEKHPSARTKGSYAHAENALVDMSIEYGPSDDCHEKTVLRCTFCRREYHGPNAKSMWRRHVFDKHKVAMKNRREGSAGMAPKLPQTQKKTKVKVPGSSNAVTFDSPVECSTPALTLDLTNEGNILRLLERVVSGNLSINLPALQNCSANGGTVNLESIALALQKSGISLTEEGCSASISAASASKPDTDLSLVENKVTIRSNKHDKRGREMERCDLDEVLVTSATGHSFHEKLSPRALDDWTNQYRSPTWEASPSSPESNTEATLRGQKCKPEDTDRGTSSHVHANLEREPLKDNTVLDRNSHNLNEGGIPGTPHKDKGKQKALFTTPGAPDLSQESFLSSSPSPRHPYTPVKPHTALRSRALATTGEESYLTLIVSSPASVSPTRGGGRILFTSPFNTRTSPRKRSDHEGPPNSDDALDGIVSASSPRYSFDFNAQGIHSSPFISAFDPIPLELGNLGPAHWSPPSLGPPAPVSEPTSRSMSRASTIGDEIDVDNTNDMHDEDRDEDIESRDCGSSPKRTQYRRRSLEDFDMDAYIDLEDAAPASETNAPSSPFKSPTARGLQFSKEFGLLSPSQVERITASAQPKFTEDLRASKRRRVGVS